MLPDRVILDGSGAGRVRTARVEVSDPNPQDSWKSDQDEETEEPGAARLWVCAAEPTVGGATSSCHPDHSETTAPTLGRNYRNRSYFSGKVVCRDSFRRYSTTSLWFCALAISAAVCPRHVKCVSAPASISIFTTSKCPPKAARCSAVDLSNERLFTSAPAAKSCVTIEKWPYCEAMATRGYPLARLSACAPWSNRNSTTSE